VPRCLGGRRVEVREDPAGAGVSMTAEAEAGGDGTLLRLRPGVYRAVDREGQEYLLHRSASQRLGTLTGAQQAALRELAEAARSVESLRATAADSGAHDAAEIQELLDLLRAGGWLHITVVRDGRPAYAIEPYRRPPIADGGQATEDTGDLVLSRFVIIHRSGPDLVLESPRSWCSVRVHDREVAAAITSLFRPDADPTGAADDPVATHLAQRIRADLRWAGMIVPATGAEDIAFEQRMWSPYELWFHQRSRNEGPTDGGFGRTRWAAGLFEPLPGQRPPLGQSSIELVRPDLDAVRRDDATVTDALERRRSVRRHDDQRPITLDQIGEFLYRAAGIRRVVTHDDVDLVTGPNPSGGALDALEFYLAVRLADGLTPGLYRYDRVDHRLDHVCASNRPVRRLIDAAQNATTGSRDSPQTYPPQLVVLLAARFGRVGWSYETLGYSLILKQVGVAYQTMYTVATAMGLAPCALGAGDPAAFAEATGLDPLSEATVGEFILGGRPPRDDSGPDQPDQLAAT
jgi:SagB-type dehydrogenase family enzyme